MPLPVQTPFTLLPRPPNERRPKKIAEFIARMNAIHPDGFRNVHKEDLLKLKELEAQQAQKAKEAEEALRKGLEVTADTEGDLDDGGGEVDSVKEVRAARDEVLRNMEVAHLHAMQSLDFVSLLLSKEIPVQANVTLSPALREMVGIGTLGATNLSASNVTKAREPRIEEYEAISTGRKLLDIGKTADSLLSASARLQREISLETKYWADLRVVSDSGWFVSWHPHEPHTMAVKFGFSESDPQFRDNCIAALRRARDGSVNLDAGRWGGDSKRVLVSIERDGKVTGQSSLPRPLSNDAPLQQRIEEARNSLCAQELWHEINREARTLRAYNVLHDTFSVTCNLDATSKITFRLVTLSGQSWSSIDDRPSSRPEDGSAETICCALYLLLSYAHRQIARKRAQLPFPDVNTLPQLTPALALLRPLLGYLQNETWMKHCNIFLSELTSILHSAGITTASYTIREHAITLHPGAPPSEALLTRMMSPGVFKAELEITPEARFDIISKITLSHCITRFFRVTLPPLPRPPQQTNNGFVPMGKPPQPHSLVTHPLTDFYPPGEYADLDSVMYYIIQAVPRVLAKRYEATIRAAFLQSQGRAQTSLKTRAREYPKWIIALDGSSIRDRETDIRGVTFELVTTADVQDGRARTGGTHLLELRVYGYSMENGKAVCNKWSWAAKDDVQEGGKSRKQTLDEVVESVLAAPVDSGPLGTSSIAPVRKGQDLVSHLDISPAIE